MDSLATALTRLEGAVARLDDAVSAKLARDRDPEATDGGPGGEGREALERELAEARVAERNARDRVAQVADRLDATIERLRGVLQE